VLPASVVLLDAAQRRADAAAGIAALPEPAAIV
jgi:hypothetical protein